MLTPPQPYSVCLLGSMAAGKSTFLAGLAVLADSTRRGAFKVHGLDPASVDYLQELGDALRLQRWPAPTNHAERFRFEVNLEGRVLTLFVLDFPGGDLLHGLRRMEADRSADLRRQLLAADACLLLLDPWQDAREDVGESAADAAALHAERNAQAARLDALLQAVGELRRVEAGQGTASEEAAAPPVESAGGTKKPFPDLALVVTKADSVRELVEGVSPEAFLQRRIPNFLRRLKENDAADFRVFALSAVGATEQVDGRVAPAGGGRLAPTGYEAVFHWLLARRAARRRRPYLAALATLLLVGATAAFAWRTLQAVESNTIAVALQDSLAPPRERLRRSLGVPSAVAPLRAELFRQELDRVAANLESAANESELAAVEKDLGDLAGLQPGPALERIRKLEERASSRREEALFGRVRAAFEQQEAGFAELAALYLQQFSAGGQRRAQVVAWQRDDLERRLRRARQVVARTPSSSPEELRAKVKAIDAFLKEYGPALDQQTPDPARGESKAMRRAADLAQLFSEPQSYRIRLVRTGAFVKPRSQIVEVFCDGALVREFRSPTASTVRTWDQWFDLNWAAGRKLRCTLREDGYVTDPLVAELQKEGPDALEVFTGSRPPAVAADWAAAVENLRFEFETEGLSAEDWRVFHDYVHPGDRWNRGASP